MNVDFFNRLYKGFRAEYVVMGELYGIGLEAFKLPGDFGFDLIVTNLKESNDGSTKRDRAIAPPYSLQIKSTSVKSIEYKNSANDRGRAEVDFYLKQEEMDLIISNESAYYVFVIFLPSAERALSDRHICFWLHGSQIKKMKEAKYFEPCVINNVERHRLSAVVYLKPTQITTELLGRMSDNLISEEGKKFLLSALPERFDMNWDAGEYISLKRPSKTEKNQKVEKMVPKTMIGLQNLGVKVRMEM